MNKTVANKDLFIRLTSKLSSGLTGRPWPQLYQQILRNKSFLDARATTTAGEELISVAESAHAFRRYDVVQQASDLMLALPLTKPFKSAGLYYKQLSIQCLGAGDLDEAEALINVVVQNAAPPERGRALLSLAAVHSYRGNRDAELSYYLEALRAAESQRGFDPVTVVTARRMIAVWKAKDGSPGRALADLERLLPLARMEARRHPSVYADYLNSLAVELLSAGRCEDARRASSQSISSPYAIAYPEWHDTHADIISRMKRCSVLYLDVWPPGLHRRQRRAKILPMPVNREHSPSAETASSREPARVIDFHSQVQREPKKRKTRMGKPIDRSEIASLSADEMKFICSQILMESSDDLSKLDYLYNALPSDLRARAFIELVLSTALQDDELRAVLDNLMTDNDQRPIAKVREPHSAPGSDDPESA